MNTDYHHKNMTNLGLYNQAGIHGSVDNLNDYIATYMHPKLSQSARVLRLKGMLSMSDTIRRLMDLKTRGPAGKWPYNTQLPAGSATR